MTNLRIYALVAVVIVAGMSMEAPAHEGHDNLPTTGVTVKGNRLLISAQREQVTWEGM